MSAGSEHGFTWMQIIPGVNHLPDHVATAGLVTALLIIVPALLPVFFILEYAAWLWWYGHSLNAMGAFTLKPFMPTVFGDGKVAQFTTHSYPHYGFGLMVASSLFLALAALIRRKQLLLAGEKGPES